MLEKKITAVEWLIEKFKDLEADFKYSVIDYETYKSKQITLLEEAKDIDKEQKEEFFKAGKKYAYGDSIAMDWGEETEELNFEQYYNKNFK